MTRNKPGTSHQVIKRAAVYCRVSTDKQDDENATSLQRQEEQSVLYAQSHGYTVQKERIFKDVYTGKEYRERPGMTALRQAAHNGEFDVVIVYVFDRLARKQVHQAVIIDDLEHCGVKIECVTENFDDSAIGQFMRSTYAFLAEIEREKILKRTQDGKLDRVKAGKLLGAKPLYGYEWTDPTVGTKKGRTRYKLHPEKSKMVHRTFVMYDNGATIYEIAHTYTNEGMPTPSGGKVWEASFISRLLRNPYYMGKAMVFKQVYEVRGKSKHYIDVPEEEQIQLPDGIVPPIVDEALFNRVQVRLRVNLQDSGRNNKRKELALLRSGFIKCAHCGYNMVAHAGNNGTTINYVCRRNSRGYGECKSAIIAVNKIDPVVWDYAVSKIKEPDQIDGLVAQWLEQDPTENDTDYVPRRLAEIEVEIANLRRLARSARTESTMKQFEEDLAKLDLEKQDLEKEERIRKTIEERWVVAQEKILEFKAWCDQFRDTLETATYEEKRRALRYLGIVARVRRYGEKPRYELDFKPPDIMLALS